MMHIVVWEIEWQESYFGDAFPISHKYVICAFNINYIWDAFMQNTGFPVGVVV